LAKRLIGRNPYRAVRRDWALILSEETPACVALVAKPARRLWPEKAGNVDPGSGDALLDDERDGLAG